MTIGSNAPSNTLNTLISDNHTFNPHVVVAYIITLEEKLMYGEVHVWRSRCMEKLLHEEIVVWRSCCTKKLMHGGNAACRSFCIEIFLYGENAAAEVFARRSFCMEKLLHEEL